MTEQISQLVNQIAIAISEITGEPINQALIDEILASIDIDDIVSQIIANVQVSLGILEECLDLTPTPPPPPPVPVSNVCMYGKITHLVMMISSFQVAMMTVRHLVHH